MPCSRYTDLHRKVTCGLTPPLTTVAKSSCKQPEPTAGKRGFWSVNVATLFPQLFVKTTTKLCRKGRRLTTYIESLHGRCWIQHLGSKTSWSLWVTSHAEEKCKWRKKKHNKHSDKSIRRDKKREEKKRVRSEKKKTEGKKPAIGRSWHCPHSPWH